METKLIEVKLVKQGDEGLIITQEESGTCPADDSKTGHNACHPDLVKAVQGLALHLAILSDWLPEKTAASNKDTLEPFVVTGYALGGKKGNEGVTIKGYRKNSRGGISILNPFILFEQAPDKAYQLIGDVQKKIRVIEKEVHKYFADGKRKDPELYGEGEGSGEGDPGVRSLYPSIPAADKDAQERVKNDGENKGGKKNAS